MCYMQVLHWSMTRRAAHRKVLQSSLQEPCRPLLNVYPAAELPCRCTCMRALLIMSPLSLPSTGLPVVRKPLTYVKHTLTSMLQVPRWLEARPEPL